MDSGILHTINLEIPTFMKSNLCNYITDKEAILTKAIWAAGRVGYDIKDIDFVFLEGDNPHQNRNSGGSFRLGLYIKDFDPGKATQFKLLISGDETNSS